MQEIEKINRELSEEIEKLKKQIKALKSKKHYGLVWEEKEPEKIVLDCQYKIPILKEIKTRGIVTDNEKPRNILIEGDNYHALSVLNYTHKNKIDVIYIDPPYNTGNKDFKYNDHWIDREDNYRHSKWLSFMEKRLMLARELLKEDGAIFISIDDNELYPLKLLCDQIFVERDFIRTMVWKKKTGSGAKIYQIFDEHEYILVYARNIEKTRTWRIRDVTHGNFKNPDNDLRGPWESCAITAPSKNRNPNQLYCIEVFPKKQRTKIQKETKYGISTHIFDYQDKTVVFRRPANDKQFSEFDKADGCCRFVRRWAYVPESMLNIFNEKKVYLNNTNIPRFKKFKSDYVGKALPSIYFDDFSTQEGSDDLKKILPDAEMDYPKPVGLIKNIINSTTNQNSIILDFFAGSGTTGHAVLELNKENGGNRKFILCTNNEDNNGDGMKIATDICYPRLEKIIKGYKNSKGEKVEGFDGNLLYFKTELLDIDHISHVSDEQKIKLTYQAGEIIALREGTFEEVEKDDWWQIFKNGTKYTAIYFKEDKKKLNELVKKLSKLKEKVTLYIFSWGKNEYNNEFSDYKNIKVEDIPEPIIEVYKEVNRLS